MEYYTAINKNEGNLIALIWKKCKREKIRCRTVFILSICMNPIYMKYIYTLFS